MLRRLFPILLLSLLIAPGHWLRTPVRSLPGAPVTLHPVDDALTRLKMPSGWTMEGIWELRSPDPMFGGFSALLPLDNQRFLAFSDRGRRLAFSQPGDGFEGEFAEQEVNPAHAEALWDIESATRDPATGQTWLGFENTHAIHRFGAHGQIGPVRIIDDEVDWSNNSGAEAMVRLSDGRFILIPEGGGEALVYARDPVTGVEARRVAITSPLPDFAITDAIELPDGRLMILMRNLTLGWEGGIGAAWEARIAVADVAADMAPAGKLEEIRLRMVLNLTAFAPPDNYEALALRERADGAIELWVMTDDNLSAFQRTLLVKLRFDPKTIVKGETERAASPSGTSPTKQKARE